MCYSATHLEKLDPTREQQWQKVARLTPEDMAMVTNLEYLGVPGERAQQRGQAARPSCSLAWVGGWGGGVGATGLAADPRG